MSKQKGDEHGCTIRLPVIRWKKPATHATWENDFHHSNVNWDKRKILCDKLSSAGSTGCFGQDEFTVSVLRRLGIVPSNFALDDVSNLQTLNADWYKCFEFGLWSWCPALEEVHRLILHLKMERSERQVIYDKTGTASWRQWDASWLDRVAYDVAIMCADMGPIFRRRVSEPKPDFLEYHPSSSDGHLHLNSPDGPRLVPFFLDRKPGSEVNPFLVALSCHNKLRVYFECGVKLGLPAETSPHFELYTVLTQLVDEIWTPLESLRAITPEDRNETVDGGEGSLNGVFQFILSAIYSTLIVQLDAQTASQSRPPELETTTEREGAEVRTSNGVPVSFSRKFMEEIGPMTVAERVEYGNNLFFKPLLDFPDD
ncbi:hypothetical protein B0H13DRAFT_1999780 [Mycena leptocephala]|nr:hypothetical protein B0H13DRAFT_1999780 [Mycena leptocephala]